MVPLGNYTSSSTPPPPADGAELPAASSPGTPTRAARALALGVRWALQPWAPERVAKCGRVRITGAVTLGVRPRHGAGAGVGAHFDGLVRCGSVWECPTCSLAIRAERCAEIEHVAEWWRGRGGGLLMLTLTVRHARQHDARGTRRGLMRAWGKVTAGAPWQRWCNAAGLAGWVRSVEITHGPNGWHPHLHVLLFVGSGAELPAAVDELRTTLAERWRRKVAAVMGDDHEPTLGRGTDLRPAHVAGYLSKVALELTAAQNKRGRGDDYRSPWQIAGDFLAWGDEDDLRLWRCYGEAMRGARFVEWSRGRMDLRRASGLGDERSDEEIAAGTEGDEAPLLDIPAATWDARRDDVRWQLAVLTAAERDDRAALAELVPDAVWHVAVSATPPPEHDARTWRVFTLGP